LLAIEGKSRWSIDPPFRPRCNDHSAREISKDDGSSKDGDMQNAEAVKIVCFTNSLRVDIIYEFETFMKIL
jgi:hypothetical protein